MRDRVLRVMGEQFVGEAMGPAVGEFWARISGFIFGMLLISAVNTVIGLAYYLRVAAIMFAPDTEPATRGEGDRAVTARRRHLATTLGIAIAAVAVVLLSVYPQPVLDWASHAAALAAPR